jgi:hypothetical protein
MKNLKFKLFILLLITICLPFAVDAKEGCNILSGNGKDIGSELACGSEHFYIVGVDDNNLKLLSKYNLYVGSDYNRIILNLNETYIRQKCRSATNCGRYGGSDYKYFFESVEVDSYETWITKIYNKYNLTDLNPVSQEVGTDPSDGTLAYYSELYGDIYKEGNDYYQKYTYKLYPYTTITENTNGYALQNENAVGVHGTKGNPIYPTIATFHMSYKNDDYLENDVTYKDGYINYELSDSHVIKKYFNDYKNNLIKKGYEPINIDMLNIKDLDEIVYKLTNKNLPLSEWFEYSHENYNQVEDDYSSYVVVGSLKDFLQNNNSWLWETSSWLKTKENSSADHFYFISTSGEICYSYEYCFSGIPRAGLRPVVTMSKNVLKYNINTKTDSNGTIEVVDSAFGGDVIKFKISAKKGYKLAGLTVTTDSGESIKINKEDITLGVKELYSISTNEFTMPYENITIEAKWVDNVTNPNTGRSTYVLSFLLISVIGIFVISLVKKKKKF